MSYEKDMGDAKTLSEIFKVVEKHYDTQEKLGIATKLLIVTNLPKLIKMANVKPKK
jgi:hypothetical protein